MSKNPFRFAASTFGFKLFEAIICSALSLTIVTVASADDKALPHSGVNNFVTKADKPILDGAGNRSYTLMLNEGLVREADARNEAPARGTMDPENTRDSRGWHEPRTRAVVKILESKYQFEVISMTSYVYPSVSAYLPLETVERLRLDPLVTEISENSEISFAAAPPWADQVVGGETISWGKSAVETDDALTSSNVVYVIDGGVTNHPDLNVTHALIGVPWDYYPDTGVQASNPQHATHVAGIIGAANYNAHSRGINPGQNIISVHSGGGTNLLNTAIDWVLADAEQKNVYGVANMSISNDTITPIWKYDTPGGRAIRNASNRVLFVQAAGNNKEDTCVRSFATIDNNSLTLTANPVDGIVVVGGLNQNAAQQFPFDNSAVTPPFRSDNGSNYGHCVEMWAPSVDIISSWTSVVTGAPLMYTTSPLSGTSMAAPHVAGLAARFGTTATTPVEREYHLRARLAGYPDAGYLYADESRIPIEIPQLNKTPAYSIPTRLTPVNITANATAAGTTMASTQDSQYTTGSFWNAGSPVGWIEFDLGATRTIRAIRMSPELSAANGGTTTHDVYVGNSPNPTTLAVHINELSFPKSPIARKFPDAGTLQGRYIRIASDTTGVSWLSWREVEIYGN